MQVNAAATGDDGEQKYAHLICAAECSLAAAEGEHAVLSRLHVGGVACMPQKESCAYCVLTSSLPCQQPVLLQRQAEGRCAQPSLQTARASMQPVAPVPATSVGVLGAPHKGSGGVEGGRGHVARHSG